MSSSLLLQQCSASLVCLILIVFVMGGRWPYSCSFVGCCLQALFNIAGSILVLLPSSFFSLRLVSIHVVQLYSSIDTTAARKKPHFLLTVRSDFLCVRSKETPWTDDGKMRLSSDSGQYKEEQDQNKNRLWPAMGKHKKSMNISFSVTIKSKKNPIITVFLIKQFPKVSLI